MNCAGWERKIALYVGEDLSGQEICHTEQHLEICPECRQLADELRASREILKQMTEPLPENLLRVDLSQRVMPRLAVPSGPLQRFLKRYAFPLHWQWIPVPVSIAFVSAFLWFLSHPGALEKPGPKPVASFAQVPYPRKQTAAEPTGSGYESASGVLHALPMAQTEEALRPSAVFSKRTNAKNPFLPKLRESLTPVKMEKVQEIWLQMAQQVEWYRESQGSEQEKNVPPADYPVAKLQTDNPKVVIYWFDDEVKKGKGL
jgi:hypothetical protein